jgi:hypothetical protein
MPKVPYLLKEFALLRIELLGGLDGTAGILSRGQAAPEDSVPVNHWIAGGLDMGYVEK